MFVRLLIAAVLAALVAPGIAQAHHTAVPIVALDYRNHVVPTPAEKPGVSVAVVDAGRKLQVSVTPAHSIYVLGYEDEDFLLVDFHGVQVNPRSTTARGPPSGAEPTARPSPRAAPWRQSRSRRSAWPAT